MSPKPSAPSVVPARLAAAPCIKPRGDTSTYIGRSSWSILPPIGGALSWASALHARPTEFRDEETLFWNFTKVNFALNRAALNRTERNQTTPRSGSLRLPLLHCSTH